MSRGLRHGSDRLADLILGHAGLARTGRLVLERWQSRKNVLELRTRTLHTDASTHPSEAELPRSWSSDGAGAARTSHLNPSPDDYTISRFTDRCHLTVQAGAGGHGCISFLREKYVPDGPANGGDGGTGGSIFIQAVRGETSLHKLARRRTLRAGRGGNGRGKTRGGERGEDVLIQVPVGTVVREIARQDPVAEEFALMGRDKAFGRDSKEPSAGPGDADQTEKWRRDKWLLYPGALPRSFTVADFPALPRPRRSNLSASQPKAPIRLDLDTPMDTPMLLAAGAVGGLGNPHFVTKSITRPKYATKGQGGMTLDLHLELKLLADVGLVGLPNAGKSTLLRSLTRSRARVASYAFTTLQPNMGTVVLDDHKARPFYQAYRDGVELRESFTIADIPGLMEGAHLDRGLGLDFLRHVERAAVLAFVLDLSGTDPINTLQALWYEVSKYETLREQQLSLETQRLFGPQDALSPFLQDDVSSSDDHASVLPATKSSAILTGQTFGLEPLRHQPISSKPWLVVASKADLPETQEAFRRLQEYLENIQKGLIDHPSARKNSWRSHLQAVPVSAIQAQGIDRVVPAILQLLKSGPGARPA